MTVCRVFLFGLKPCDISSSTNDKISDILIPATPPKNHPYIAKDKVASTDLDFLNLDIKPINTPSNINSTTNTDKSHESSPIHVTIREKAQGRHRICVSQTLLRTHIGDD